MFTRDGYVQGYEIEIEVFQVPNESPLSLVQEIEKKVKKAYSKKTMLVCQIRKSNFKSTLGAIHDQVRKLRPNNEIWIIGGASPKGQSDYLVAQVYPEIKEVHIDISKILDELVEPAFITATLGKQSRLVYEPLGKRLVDTKFTIHDMPDE